jgi:hypothetical protein
LGRECVDGGVDFVALFGGSFELDEIIYAVQGGVYAGSGG